MQRYKLFSESHRRVTTRVKNVIILGLLLISTLSVSAQSLTVTMPQANMIVSEALVSIEKQAGLKFSWDRSFDIEKRVALPTTATSFAEIMKIILNDTNKIYVSQGHNIIIKDYLAPVVIAPDTQPLAATPVVAVHKPEETQGVLIPTHTQRIGVEPEPIVVPEPLGNYQVVSGLGKTPVVAIKTNLLYDATATASLGAEIKLGRKLTLDLPFTHNSWSTSGDRKWENFVAQPGLRLWSCEAFNGHFFGVHAHYAKYNVGSLPSPFSATMRDYRFEGQLYGVGINYGYQWILGKRWAMEAEIGVGWAHLWGDKYQCGDCGTPVGEFKKDYFGPTKAGISMIFIIK